MALYDSEFKRLARRFFELGVEVGRSERMCEEWGLAPSSEGDVVSLDEWRVARNERKARA